MSGPGDYIGAGPGQRIDYAAVWAAADLTRALQQPARGLTLRERMQQAAAEARDRKGRALREVAGVRTSKARAPVASGMPDSVLRDLAERRAEHLGRLLDEINTPTTAAGLLAWLNAEVEALQGRPFAFEGERPEAAQLAGFLARARCAMWWRRQLRRECVRLREAEGRAAGEVCATRRQAYVTHDTAHRHALRREATAKMMAATELENDAGQVMALLDLAAASVSNKAIRRGELMTRISGCERWAEAHNMPGVFLTLTAPSRFHAVHRVSGQKNARHDGSTPRDAQAWLSACWAKARAALHRRGLGVFGFRVAEPHHDGTPHWHALLWAESRAALLAVWFTLRAHWLAEDGDEPGAAEYRINGKLMEPGGAAGYIAKYVAKNIDDAGSVGAEGHRDDDAPQFDAAAVPEAAQGDLFGGTAQRVEAWASAHRIRQFQAIGQPPVTVWRELRRIEEPAGATPRLARALEAANREGGRLADWAAYVLAQGGMNTGRGYLLRVAVAMRERHGRYEVTNEPRPIGVIDTTGPGEVQASNRREWKPRGAWAEGEQNKRGPWAPRVPPWTRVNNCTARGATDLMRSGIVGAWRAQSIEPGAARNHEGPSHDPERHRQRHHRRP